MPVGHDLPAESSRFTKKLSVVLTFNSTKRTNRLILSSLSELLSK